MGDRLETGYFAKTDSYDFMDWKACISRKYPWFVKTWKLFHYPALAPSAELLKDWKEKKITWDEYETRYRNEIISSEDSMEQLHYLIYVSQYAVVRLMCWEKGEDGQCHRFILEDMMRECFDYNK